MSFALAGLESGGKRRRPGVLFPTSMWHFNLMMFHGLSVVSPAIFSRWRSQASQLLRGAAAHHLAGADRRERGAAAGDPGARRWRLRRLYARVLRGGPHLQSALEKSLLSTQ